MSKDPCMGSTFEWRKSRYSVNNGACVEVAAKPGIIAIRDSADRAGVVIQYFGHAWQDFLTAVKNGEFDATLE